MNQILDFYGKIISLYDIKIFKVCFDILKVIIIAFISKKIGYFLIDRFYIMQERSKIQFPEKKMKTLSSLTKNVLRYVIYFIAGATILKIFGTDMSSIIAVAGIGSLAIGFGAQSLVRDILTGFFIIFEDQFSVGDYITINNFSGTVEEIGLRITKTRDFSGELHIIPNGEIKIVTNHTRGGMRALVNIGISYEADVDSVIKILNEICDDVKKSRDDILEGPTVLGITDFKDSSIGVTIVANTKPMQQWAVERELRYRIKQVFDEKNVEFPYPHLDVTIKDGIK
ncbi:mechanosensitive ion channel family protein [Aceticella autotrophica]|uniref:Mechanosensitive ion channel family protein n=1 Tax=Aceticella autotrophica TaxID=2755338 RepID=A0A975AVR3_9THEO|nr:mechanosensitive ion channel family protein [Aceticella autotrophica]QSZ27352.1 mechanosensitive ion channel family protein [Aceticella autotrophica]